MLAVCYISDVSERSSGETTGGASPDEGTARVGASTSERKMKVTIRTVVLPDGTYGTEDVYEAEDDYEGKATGEIICLFIFDF